MVQPGDWLTEIALAYYGDIAEYARIVEATNAVAAVDPSFATIVDPNQIAVGWKLWIPLA